MAEEGAAPGRVEIVLRANDAWNRRDADAWLSFLSPDIVLRPISTFTDSQERRGLDATRLSRTSGPTRARTTSRPRPRASASTATS
jgi:ketosteroid isomerase-like protein